MGKLRPGVGRCIQGHATPGPSRAPASTPALLASHRDSGLPVLAGLQSGLGSQAWRAHYGLAAREVLFCFAASGMKVRSWETLGTPDLERRVVDVGRRGAGVPEGPGVGLLGFTSRLPRVQTVTLALPESQLLCLKNGMRNVF